MATCAGGEVRCCNHAWGCNRQYKSHPSRSRQLTALTLGSKMESPPLGGRESMDAVDPAKFTPVFLAALLADVDAQVAAIIRCDQLSPTVATATEAAGLAIVRTLRLIRGLAVVGRAGALLQLSSAAWVLRIEPDQPVHTTHRETHL